MYTRHNDAHDGWSNEHAIDAADYRGHRDSEPENPYRLANRSVPACSSLALSHSAHRRPNILQPLDQSARFKALRLRINSRKFGAAGTRGDRTASEQDVRPRLYRATYSYWQGNYDGPAIASTGEELSVSH